MIKNGILKEYVNCVYPFSNNPNKNSIKLCCVIDRNSMSKAIKELLALKETKMKHEDIARVCHNANKALCEAYGDNSQVDWDKAEPWQRDSAIAGVKFVINNPDAPASATHDSWLADKEKAGWKYGPIKDPVKKEHPCMVPYYQLPIDQKVKDYVFGAVVRSLKDYCEGGVYDPNKRELNSPLVATQTSIQDATTVTADGKLQTDLTKLTARAL